MEFNKEQIKKELVLLIDDMPKALYLNPKKTSLFLTFLNSIYNAIMKDEKKIMEQEEQIFKLENRLKECENGYEGTLHLDRAKLHDAEQKIEELKAYNENLKKANTYLSNHLFDEVKLAKDLAITDTVRKFAEKHAEVMKLFLDDDNEFIMKWCEYEVNTQSVIDEILEGINEVQE